MALKPLHPCNYPGCRELTRERYCEKHQRRKEDRPSAHQRGYTYQWSKASKAYLCEHPWCAECLRHNKWTPAVLVDHIKPHKGDPRLFWDQSNWQGLCLRCHNIKTASEDGGFGNARRR